MTSSRVTDGTTWGILGHSRRPGVSRRVHLPRVAAVLWAAAVLVVVGLWPAMAAEGTATRFAADTVPVAATPASTSPNPAGETSVTPATTVATPSTGVTSVPPSVSPSVSPSTTSSSPSSPAPSPTSSASSPPATRPPTPPASSTSTIPLSTVLVALAVLAAASIVVLRLARPTTDSALPEEGAAGKPVGPDADILVAMAVMGEALIDSGFDVTDVQSDLGDVGRAYGVPNAEIIVLPTAVLISARTGGELRTGVVSSGRTRLRLHQTEELVDVVRGAQAGSVDPRRAYERIAEIRAQPPLFGPGLQLVGHVLATVGLATILGASWLGLAICAGLGALAGALLLVGRRLPSRFEVLMNVATSFGVALVVLLLSRAGAQFDIIPCLIAPLVILLPGALLTTSVIELVTGQMISGAGRLAAGVAQLVLLGLGIVAAAALVGVPAFDVPDTPPPLGAAGPWLAVAVFGIGIVLNQCARPTSLGWIMLVLYVAYGAQVVGGLAFGGVLSAFVGAAAMTPVAALVARQRTGPPMIVSFTPAFWLLVPGALGLVGVAALLQGDTSGASIVVTTVETMVAIAVGVMVGRALSLFVTDQPSAPDPVGSSR